MKKVKDMKDLNGGNNLYVIDAETAEEYNIDTDGLIDIQSGDLPQEKSMVKKVGDELLVSLAVGAVFFIGTTAFAVGTEVYKQRKRKKEEKLMLSALDREEKMFGYRKSEDDIHAKLMVEALYNIDLTKVNKDVIDI